MWRETITLCLYLLSGVTEGIEIELARTLSVAVGNDANLTVRYSSSTRPHVTWSSGDVFALWSVGENTSVSVSEEYEGRLKVNTSTASIVIVSTRFTDSGMYSVSLRAVAETPTSRNITLRVYELITDVRVVVPTVDVKEGDVNVVLTCAMGSGSWDLLSWFKDGVMILDDSRRLLASNELTIRNVIRGDTGSYSCFVQNPFSNGSAQGSLRVYYGPDVPRVTITSPSDPSPESYVLVNSTVTLTCSSASEPEAGYVWSIGESGNTEVPHNAILTLRRVRLDQAGTYSCIATNPRLSRSVRKSLSLNVYELPEGGPQCSMVPLEGGVKLRFSCECLGGYPAPVLQWVGLSQNPTSVSPLIQDEESPENLHRVNVSCVCQHPAGNRSCLLQPEAPLAMLTRSVRRGPQGQAMVTLRCSVTSNPAAIITWLRDQAELGNSGNIALSTNSSVLHVQDFSLRNDTGNYSCSCTSPLGQSTPSTHLTAPRLSGPSVLRLNGTAVSLIWSLRPSDVVTSFLIQSRTGTQRTVSPSNSWSTLQEAPMSQRSAVIPGLRTDTGYSFRVIPVTGNQLGEASPTQFAPAVVNNRLSAGAIAGIVVGCVVGTALILLLIICFIRHHGKKKKTLKEKQTPSGKPPLPVQNAFPQWAPTSPSGAIGMQNHKPNPKGSISNKTEMTTDGWDWESSMYPKSLYANGPRSGGYQAAADSRAQGQLSEKAIPPASRAPRPRDSSRKPPLDSPKLSLQQRSATMV